ncbi:hypothetical protein FGO68_gene8051 [Halteria grandinella]|uniref:Uncharacterized protein n=1 Tax=Halteria grandinella TaxID=5974 RepID=A0A8J8NUJ2_HALGN|nr:hypothetical protein FGO68_gene8051 [Halteria grandinella]
MRELGIGSVKTLANISDKLLTFGQLKKFSCTVGNFTAEFKDELIETLSKFVFLEEIQLTIEHFKQTTREIRPECLQELANFPKLRKITVHTNDVSLTDKQLMAGFSPTQIVRKVHRIMQRICQNYLKSALHRALKFVLIALFRIRIAIIIIEECIKAFNLSK